MTAYKTGNGSLNRLKQFIGFEFKVNVGNVAQFLGQMQYSGAGLEYDKLFSKLCARPRGEVWGL